MTTPRETRAKALNALAVLMTELRHDANLPPWDVPGCVAALRTLDLPLPAIGYAAIRYATDPTNTTPTHITDLGNRAWEAFDPWPCKTHPQSHGRRLNGECGACWADRNASPTPGQIRDRGGRPIPADTRRTVTATLHRQREDQPT